MIVTFNRLVKSPTTPFLVSEHLSEQTLYVKDCHAINTSFEIFRKRATQAHPLTITAPTHDMEFSSFFNQANQITNTNVLDRNKVQTDELRTRVTYIANPEFVRVAEMTNKQEQRRIGKMFTTLIR